MNDTNYSFRVKLLDKYEPITTKLNNNLEISE